MLDGSMLKIIPPQYRDRHLKAMERIIETGEFGGLVGTTMEVGAMHRDGHEFPIELSVNAWEADGKVFCSSIIRDISERQRAEGALRESEQRLLAILQESPVSIGLIKATDNTMAFANARYDSMFGFEKGAPLTAQRWDRVLGPGDAAALRI
jgi:PAS domain-containing protein